MESYFESVTQLPLASLTLLGSFALLLLYVFVRGQNDKLQLAKLNNKPQEVLEGEKSYKEHKVNLKKDIRHQL